MHNKTIIQESQRRTQMSLTDEWMNKIWNVYKRELPSHKKE